MQLAQVADNDFVLGRFRVNKPGGHIAKSKLQKRSMVIAKCKL